MSWNTLPGKVKRHKESFNVIMHKLSCKAAVTGNGGNQHLRNEASEKLTQRVYECNKAVPT